MQISDRPLNSPGINLNTHSTTISIIDNPVAIGAISGGGFATINIIGHKLTLNGSTANAATKSSHILGLAVDIKDVDGKLWQWCIANLQLLKDLGLYLEDKRYTPSQGFR